MTDIKAVEEGFYKRCGELLGVDTVYKNIPLPTPRRSHIDGELFVPSTSATRWGGREPGNGRFEGKGLIRLYSVDLIHVALTSPQRVNRRFTSIEQVYTFLEEIMEIK